MLVYLKLNSIVYPKKCSKLNEKVERGASALLSTCGSVSTEPCNPHSAAKNGHSKVNSQIPQSEAEGRPLELLFASPWHECNSKEPRKESLKSKGRAGQELPRRKAVTVPGAAIEDCQGDWLDQDFWGVFSTSKAHVGLSHQGNGQLQVKTEKTISYSSSLLQDGFPVEPPGRRATNPLWSLIPPENSLSIPL